MSRRSPASRACRYRCHGSQNADWRNHTSAAASRRGFSWKASVAAKPIYETLPLAPNTGLYRLPEPSPGDIFLDLEADPFVGEEGLEFLFGYACAR